MFVHSVCALYLYNKNIQNLHQGKRVILIKWMWWTKNTEMRCKRMLMSPPPFTNYTAY